MKKKEDGKNLNTLILCQKINGMHKLQTDYSLLASDLKMLKGIRKKSEPFCY